jgi:VIT1/CCC1 family predicted Fe2+/Mn2+ transporter
MGKGENSSQTIARIINSLCSIVYWVVFAYTSFKIYQIAVETHPHVWIVCNMLNGIFGGIFLIYPFAFIKYGYAHALYYWVNYLILFFILTVLSLLISESLGMGGI